MLFKKYKIIRTIQFRRVESHYVAPCYKCKLYGTGKFLCKNQFKIDKSIFDLCREAQDTCNSSHNYMIS